MTNHPPDKVTRFCPECKSRISAAESQFAKPQICPKCKTRVLFVDYLKVRPELPPDLDLFVESGNPLTQPKVQMYRLVGGRWASRWFYCSGDFRRHDSDVRCREFDPRGRLDRRRLLA